MRKIMVTALSAVLLLALGPTAARAAATTEIEVFWTTLVARGAAVDVNFGITCPADVDGAVTVAITQTRDDGLIASGTTTEDFSCRNGGILNISRVTASVLGAPFERGRARLTMLVTGAAPISQNVRLQN
ncbi:hypothetical protein OWR29_30380 [Actinoplanes sp. Pm04-4]|uniref:Uncharacterized protein n=1 Tax=Paractinoplanes pyxinae TaxID=2997416 RepID=A0ABT4B738_9ACTN|nr:hypothetical protein [Actinoplanes pyxinae]MCY1142325.1 hypothetical protein [Actinoplanes pyxinae]